MDYFVICVIAVVVMSGFDSAKKAYIRTHTTPTPPEPGPSPEHIEYLTNECFDALSKLERCVDTVENFHLDDEDLSKFRVAINDAKFNQNVKNLKALYDNMIGQLKPKVKQLSNEQVEFNLLFKQANTALETLEDKMNDASDCETTPEGIQLYRVRIDQAYNNGRKKDLIRLIEDILEESENIYVEEDDL